VRAIASTMTFITTLAALGIILWAGAFNLPGSYTAVSLALLGAFFLAAGTTVARQANQETGSRGEQQQKAGFFAWYIGGVVFFLLSVYWMPEAAMAYYAELDIKKWHAITAYTVSCLLMALQFPFALWIIRNLPFGKILDQSGLRLALGWTTAEILFYNPFPWYYGNLLIPLTPLAQLADIAGVPLVSFTALWLMSLLVNLVLGVKRSLATAIIALILASVGSYSFSRDLAIEELSHKAPVLRVALIQGNDPLIDDRNSETRTEVISRYLRYSAEIRPQPDLFIWPEGPYFGPIAGDINYLDPNFNTAAPPIRRPLIFAALTTKKIEESEDLFFQISSIVLKPDGQMYQGYQKRRTLPFAEDIPFKEQLPWLTKIFGDRYFIAGTESTPVTIERPIGRGQIPTGEPYSAATLICYEDLLPWLFRDMLKQHKVDILIGLSNSQWFGSSVATKQHALLARWRAIENGRYFLRATTTGLTQVIDPRGRVVSEIEPFAPGYLLAEVPLLTRNTTFTRVGSVPIRILAVIILLGCLICYISRARRKAKLT